MCTKLSCEHLATCKCRERMHVCICVHNVCVCVCVCVCVHSMHIDVCMCVHGAWVYFPIPWLQRDLWTGHSHYESLFFSSTHPLKKEREKNKVANHYCTVLYCTILFFFCFFFTDKENSVFSKGNKNILINNSKIKLEGEYMKKSRKIINR